MTRAAYMRQWQRDRRWRGQVEGHFARIVELLERRPEGKPLPPIPPQILTAWKLSTGEDDLSTCPPDRPQAPPGDATPI